MQLIDAAVFWWAVRRPQEELRKEAMDAICALAGAMGSDFAIFIPSIRKLLHKHRLTVSAMLGYSRQPCCLRSA